MRSFFFTYRLTQNEATRHTSRRGTSHRPAERVASTGGTCCMKGKNARESRKCKQASAGHGFLEFSHMLIIRHLNECAAVKITFFTPPKGAFWAYFWGTSSEAPQGGIFRNHNTRHSKPTRAISQPEAGFSPIAPPSSAQKLPFDSFSHAMISRKPKRFTTFAS